MSKPVKPTKAPCKSCPYRKDVPPGIWAAHEYSKLPPYDAQMWAQPPNLFMCHNEPSSLCAGWVGCHGPRELLALRLRALAPPRTLNPPDVIDPSTFGYVSPVPLFASGTEAALHGMSGIESPDEKARRAIDRLEPKLAKRKKVTP